MNNDIKEILDNVKKCCEIMEDQNFVVYQKQDISKVLNYITNLQKENEELKDTIKKDNHLLGCNFSKKDKYKQERDIYKQRNEKAVEYIKSHKPSDIGICGNNKKYYYKLNEDSVDNLLNILQGGDE